MKIFLRSFKIINFKIVKVILLSTKKLSQSEITEVKVILGYFFLLLAFCKGSIVAYGVIHCCCITYF